MCWNLSKQRDWGFRIHIISYLQKQTPEQNKMETIGERFPPQGYKPKLDLIVSVH